MENKVTVKRFKISDKVLNNTPLFFNYIYYNELIDEVLEKKIVRRSKRKQAEFAFRAPNKLISKTIDFSNLEY